MRKINIAIDGPSAAGKSTISNILARRLNYVHLDTGAMYRCAALKAIHTGIALDDEQRLVQMLKDTDIRLTPDSKVFLDGEDVTKEIRENNVSMAASNISKLKQIRIDLVARQQEMAKAGGFIMDGRDIGTVVLKDAEVKIFMTASAHARAVRRMNQNQEAGIASGNLDSIEAEISQRDYQDTHRANSPLKKADDAVEIDTSDLTVDQTAQAILDVINRKNRRNPDE